MDVVMKNFSKFRKSSRKGEWCGIRANGSLIRANVLRRLLGICLIFDWIGLCIQANGSLFGRTRLQFYNTPVFTRLLHLKSHSHYNSLSLSQTPNLLPYSTTFLHHYHHQPTSYITMGPRMSLRLLFKRSRTQREGSSLGVARDEQLQPQPQPEHPKRLPSLEL